MAMDLKRRFADSGRMATLTAAHLHALRFVHLELRRCLSVRGEG
jgi:hypothetical protein